MTRTDRHALPRWLVRGCLALPLLMLAANVLAWLRWGTDLPYFDDWRAYDMRNALSLAPERLFEAVNNTISPVGMTLEALAQRWLGGNPLPYQTLSMLGVLGGLLWLQWRLLGWVVRDRLLQALLFAFCCFMLQSGTYWGEQNLAYHQALPLLALLGASALLARPGTGGPAWAGGVFMLGLAAGLSYVSGAVAALVLGGAWLLIGWRLPAVALAARLRAGGAALSAAGLATSALQLYLTRGVEQHLQRQHMGLTWPDSLDFWAYLAGKLGRSTGHGFDSTRLELAWVALLALALLAAAALALRGLRARGASRAASRRRFAVVFLPLAAVVAAYLVLVGLGRAGLRDDSLQGAEAVFRFGYLRFHFFWITLLFPWLGAALMLRCRRAPALPAALTGLLVLALALGAMRGVFDVPRFYRAASEYRQTEIRCLQRQLGSGQPISCPGFSLMWLPDLTRAYAYARDIDASFVRYLPIVEREGFGTELLRLTADELGARAPWRNVQPADPHWLHSGGDPALTLALPRAPLLRQCRVLGVQLTLQALRPDTVQLFYQPLGESSMTERFSLRKAYAPDPAGQAQLEFSIDTPTGVEPALRIDPLDGAGRFRLIDLRVTCRLRVEP